MWTGWSSSWYEKRVLSESLTQNASFVAFQMAKYQKISAAARNAADLSVRSEYEQGLRS